VHRVLLDLLDVVRVAILRLGSHQVRAQLALLSRGSPDAAAQLGPVPVVHLRAAAHAQDVPIAQVGDHLLDLRIGKSEERLVLLGDARPLFRQSAHHLCVLDVMPQLL